MGAQMMNSTEVARATGPKTWSWRDVPRRHWVVLTLATIVLALAGGLAYVLNQHWPFRYRNVKPLLENVFASKITIGKYHRIYFPNPGFVADGITLRRNTAPDLAPVGSVDHVRVEGTWLDLLLLRRRIRRVEADGLHVVIPPPGSRAMHEDFPEGSASDFTGPTTEVGELDIYNALLDLLQSDGNRYSFPIYRLVMGDLRRGGPVSFRLKMRNAIPSGDIEARGMLGPLRADDLGQTPVNGTYTFTGVKLADVHGLRGMLQANGKFQGNFGGIEADMTANVPDFAVGNGQRRLVHGSAKGAVNALNGDVLLHAVDLQTGHTNVHAEGAISGEPKRTALQISVQRGRAEDILQPFMRTRAPIAGPVALHTSATLAPAGKGKSFFERLTMAGGFDIPKEALTNPQVARSLSAFSERAQGGREKPQDVPDDDVQTTSSLIGDVVIRNGVAHARDLIFQLPGAVARLSGDFDLRNQRADLKGNLQMQADVSHVTTGFKSVLLKPFAPFFRKKQAGASVPIRVTGMPNHYKVGQNIIPK